MIILAGVIVSFILGSLRVPVMGMTIISQVSVLIMLLFKRRNLWPLAVSAAILYTAYYCVILYAFSCVSPGFFSLWNGFSLSGIRLAGLPLEEIIWVFTFAACWMMIMAVSLEGFWVKKPYEQISSTRK